MPLRELLTEPSFLTIEEYARLQEATPSTFQGLPPVLRLKLQGVRCCIEPQEAVAQIGESSRSAQNGSTNHSSIQQGSLWVTESQVSFLPPSGTGFSLDYPSLSLHAISRSLPTALEAISPASAGCLYCQLEGVEDDEEDEAIFPELWILPAEQDSLEPLFEALSYCASLHPSVTEEEGEQGGGHPFSGVGPFGTGLLGNQEQRVDSEGAFDDAEENTSGEDVHLSEHGRTTLARLDSLIDGDPSISSLLPTTSPPASFPSADPRKYSAATNSLVLVHLPDEIFTHPPLAASLLDLLHAFGELASWSPLASFGRALIVYKEVEGAKRAKEALDRLLLPLIEEGQTDDIALVSNETLRQTGGHADEINALLRAYYGPMTELKSPDEEDDHLAVPVTDRNFLISPPGSPPIGWEPIKEDPPNRDTLADDLIRALGSIRDKGLGVQSHQPKEFSSSTSTLSSAALLSAPTLFIPPSQVKVRSTHPLASQDNINATIDIPGVMVQNVDGHDSEGEDDDLDQRFNKGMSISSVKATVESMKGSSFPSPDNRITPTGRPPLA